MAAHPSIKLPPQAPPRARSPAVPWSPSVHVTIGTARRAPILQDSALAARVFLLLRRHPRTAAAVVLPDHVHWLLRGASDPATAVRRFKRGAERFLGALGGRRPLWQRSFFDTPVETDAIARLSAGYLLANPVAAGLAERWQNYPWAYLDPAYREEDGYMLRR